MDVNPYKSPKPDQPLKRVQGVKRGIGVAIILLLTPVAMIIAVWSTCAARQIIPGAPTLLSIFGLPLAVLTGLMVSAAVLDWPRGNDPSARPNRTQLLLATPVAVTGAGVVSFGLVALIILAATSLAQYEARFRAAPFIFWLVPGATLLAMLWLAWRAGRHRR